MRIATYNIHDCIGRDRRYDPDRIARVILELNTDLIALQEVTLDHAGELARRFECLSGMKAIDGTLFERGVGRYGNLLLTTHHILDSKQHDLSFHRCEPRGAIDVTLEINAAPIQICVTHLGLRIHERQRQILHLSALLSEQPPPTILLGDFNVWRHTRAFASLTAAGFSHIPVQTFPTWPLPVLSLDRIFAQAPLRVARCWRHDSPLARIASDHFPLVAEIAGWLYPVFTDGLKTTENF